MTPFRRISPRFNAWWHAHAGSIAFFALIVVTAAGFWKDHKAIERIKRTESGLAAERTERLAGQLAAARAQALRDREALRLEIDRRARRLAIVDSLRADVLRRADVRACERNNLTRARLRQMADSDLELVGYLQRFTTAPGMPLDDFMKWRDSKQRALRRIIRDLQPIDCTKQ